MRKVVLYSAKGCHLCAAALEVVERVRSDVPFDLEVVSIDGDPELEARYRELLPAVEIGGERAFTWFVDPAAFRERLAEAEPEVAEP